MIELKEFLETIKLLEDNYNRKLPDNIVKIWYDELKKYKLEKLRLMIVECIKKYPYFPTISQVKQEGDIIQYESI